VFNIVEGLMIPSRGVEPALIPYEMTMPLQQQIVMYNSSIHIYICIINLKLSRHKLIALQATLHHN